MKLLLIIATLQIFVGCANSDYQKSVASRSVGARGYTTDNGSVGGKVAYTVTYR